MRLRLAGVASAFVAALLALACQSARPAPRSLAEWEQFDFAKGTIALADLQGLDATSLARVRGIIFGRHGRVFEDTTIQKWLMPRPWYAPDESYSAGQLNDRERANIEVVREAEAHVRGRIMPGDLVFFKDKPITVAMLGNHTTDEWDILELEIPAIHGRRIYATEGIDFPDEGDTATVYRWFNERYWYHPDTAGPYDAWEKRVSPVELANMDTIRVARMRQYANRIEPGMMGLLRATPITPAMVAENTIYELRVLRNEIYARHGRRFSTPWIQEHFSREDWYVPRDDFRESEISEIEKANLAVIRAREEERHAKLSSEALYGTDVDGLTEDDARKLRNEIFARHGYTFRDPKLAAYFATLAWYKPDPSFSESSLSDIERGNVEKLRDQEIHAKSGQRFLPEG